MHSDLLSCSPCLLEHRRIGHIADLGADVLLHEVAKLLHWVLLGGVERRGAQIGDCECADGPKPLLDRFCSLIGLGGVGAPLLAWTGR